MHLAGSAADCVSWGEKGVSGTMNLRDLRIPGLKVSTSSSAGQILEFSHT